MEPELHHADTGDGYAVPLLSVQATGTAAQSILILPALGIGARFYKPLARRLARSGINGVIMEQRGHGYSSVRASRQSDYGFHEWLAQDIPAAVNWIRQTYGGEVTPLGHSLGGHIAACYAGLHPQQVPQLILSACASPWALAYTGRQRLQLRILQAATVTMGALIGYYNGNLFGFGKREARRLMRDWRKMVSNNTYFAEGIDQDLDQLVGRYRGRVLSVRYSDDDLGPASGVQAVTGKFKQAELSERLISSEQLGSKANHVNWVREPEALCTLITDWIE